MHRIETGRRRGSRITRFLRRAAVLRAAAGLAFATLEVSAATTGVATNLWSLQPLVRPLVPSTSIAAENPVDAFVVARLASHGLKLSPEADRRTLIRRLYFDLIGLPPTPAEIDAFVKNPMPDACEALVDRLLASPHYGERLARHWLDVVHFGETHGYDKDKPRPNAWPYRDYVIRSFNADKPWARFVEEQVAGDVLYPFTRDGIEALGFIAAGPWDFIGHAEVSEAKIDGKIARHLDRDDMVANTMQSFNSLTVQCAQCHDHKFDPISQEDYYSLQAVFSAVDRTDKEYDFDPEVAMTRLALNRQRDALLADQKGIKEGVRTRAGEDLIALDRSITEAEKAAKNSEVFGYHSAIESSQNTVKWVQLDLGQPRTLKRIVLHPARDDFNNIGEGFGFPLRFKVELASDSEITRGVRLVADQTSADVPSPGIKPHGIEIAGLSARFIRVTASRLAPRQNDFIFALAELSVIDEADTNVAAGAAVTALDAIEAPPRWQKANLTDGWYPGVSAKDSVELTGLRQRRGELLTKNTLEDEHERLGKIDAALKGITSQLAILPAAQRAYIAAVHTGSGAFTGTGANGGRPRPVFLLNRGNVLAPEKEVGPGTVSALTDLPYRFDLPSNHTEGERRAALARWLSDSRNPLTWRSIVNRVWQQHFGRGIVETPNDLGNMGAKPSHPELLDWLACEFRDGGQSLKKLHRLIVTSATYQQVSDASTGAGRENGKRAGNADSPMEPLNRRLSRPTATLSSSSSGGEGRGEEEPQFVGQSSAPGSLLAPSTPVQIDADNRLLWRMNRRKLEAESVRDAMLFVSGRLDLAMGGPSFEDFVIDKPEHSPHYEYQRHDPDDPKSQRRSIYRFLVRSQPQPFMAALDCADPSMQVATRNESVTALQSLALLNNALVISLSKHFAARLEFQGGSIREQATRGFYSAIGRQPTDDEAKQLTVFAEEHGLKNLCRALFNLNEFAFVD